MNHRRFFDLLKAVISSKLTVGVFDTVFVVFVGNFGKMLIIGSIFLHVLTASVTKHKRRNSFGLLRSNTGLHTGNHDVLGGSLAIWEEHLERPRIHLIKSKSHNAVASSALDGVVSQIKSGTSSGAIIVDVDNWNSSDTTAMTFLIESVYGVLTST